VAAVQLKVAELVVKELMITLVGTTAFRMYTVSCDVWLPKVIVQRKILTLPVTDVT
jgi:hypothetical protein